MAQIPAELELAEVLRHMLAANMNVRTTDRPFEHGPVAFDGIGMSFATHPLVTGVVHDAMPITNLGKRLIGNPFVRADHRAGFDTLHDMGIERLASGVRHNARDDIAATFDHPEYNGLTRRAASSFTFASAANVCLVDLDMSIERRIAIHGRHIFANFMAHAPRGFIRHAKLALKLLSWHPMPGRGEQVHRIEPLLQGCPGPLKRRSDHRVNMMAARRAGIGGKLLEFGELALGSALRAVHRIAETKHHQVLKTRFVGRELVEKLLDSRGFSHLRNLHTFNIGKVASYVKGIIANSFSAAC